MVIKLYVFSLYNPGNQSKKRCERVLIQILSSKLYRKIQHMDNKLVKQRRERPDWLPVLSSIDCIPGIDCMHVHINSD